MAQLTKAMVDEWIRDFWDIPEAPPITAWEIKQALYGWQQWKGAQARIAELEAEVARLKDGANDALAAYRRGLTPEATLEELLAPYKEDQHGE